MDCFTIECVLFLGSPPQQKERVIASVITYYQGVCVLQAGPPREKKSASLLVSLWNQLKVGQGTPPELLDLGPVLCQGLQRCLDRSDRVAKDPLVPRAQRLQFV